jgi:hypothetical protein
VGRASRRGSGKRKSADVEQKTVTLIYPYPLMDHFLTFLITSYCGVTD